MKKAGIEFANYYLRVFTMAHFFNVLQQAKVTQGKWLELDRIITLHIGRLLEGQLPTGLSECHTHLSVRMGIIASAFARTQRASTNSSREIGQGMKHLPNLSCPGARIFYTNTLKKLMEMFLRRLEAVTQEVGTETKKTQKRLLTALQLLTKYENSLHE